MQRSTLHLRNGGTSVVLDLSTAGVPTIVHWGEDLGDIGSEHLAGLALAAIPQRVSGGIDHPARLTLLPQEAFGWQGTPGLEGHRNGKVFSAEFTTTALTETAASAIINASDQYGELALVIELEVTATGLVKQRLTLINEGAESFEVSSLAPTFPVPPTATEILDTTGRHLRERTPQRHLFTIGSHLRESRKGRPGADASLIFAAGTKGFGFESGRVHAIHVAWSGNHRLLAERVITADGFLQGSEKLTPGEIRLAQGEAYTTPWVIGSWGNGLNEVSARFHQELRARPSHPRRPRPVTLNTWEAAYFDHDLESFSALARQAAKAGVERFVLDDGWFLNRRDDTAGLGDWTVDPAVWPNGLTPLIDQVEALGMEFGLWVEPEMVNLDSDLARAHPEWVLQPGGRLPIEGRQQHVLNLANPDAYGYILASLDALLDEYSIAYLKWDHNRDLLGAGDTATGTAIVHEHTLALYRLLDELKGRHPGLEIESCASGGARVDLGILEYTDRIWTSDCIDPIERLDNQKYTGILVPPELIGAHIGGPQSHSTHRRHDLALRAGVAFFQHFGIEWDITQLAEAELTELAGWVQAHKDVRELLHHGRVVHADLPDPSTDLRGVVAQNGTRALYAFTQISASGTYPSARVHLPGLNDEASYQVKYGAPFASIHGPGQSPLLWAEDGVRLTGRTAAAIGVVAPVLYPESLVLIEAHIIT